MILRDTSIARALAAQRRGQRLRQGGFLLNPFRFATGGDPAGFSNVKFLSGFEGANGGTTFTDESSNGYAVAATTGAPTTSTTKVKYGTSALRLGGSQILGVGVAADWSWMHQTGAIWTWEGFIAVDSFASARTLFSTSNGSTGNSGIYVGLTTGRALDVEIYRAVASSYVVNAVLNSTLFPNDTNYHHLAVECDLTLGSANLTAWVDGVSMGSASKTGNAPSAAAATAALKLGGFSTTGDFAGYMDEVRITQNVVRYGSAFTPALAAFPRS